MNEKDNVINTLGIKVYHKTLGVMYITKLCIKLMERPKCRNNTVIVTNNSGNTEEVERDTLSFTKWN